MPWVFPGSLSRPASHASHTFPRYMHDKHGRDDVTPSMRELMLTRTRFHATTSLSFLISRPHSAPSQTSREAPSSPPLPVPLRSVWAFGPPPRQGLWRCRVPEESRSRRAWRGRWCVVLGRLWGQREDIGSLPSVQGSKVQGSKMQRSKESRGKGPMEQGNEEKAWGRSEQTEGRREL